MTLLQVISKIENVEGLKPVTQTTQPQPTQAPRPPLSLRPRGTSRSRHPSLEGPAE